MLNVWHTFPKFILSGNVTLSYTVRQEILRRYATKAWFHIHKPDLEHITSLPDFRLNFPMQKLTPIRHHQTKVGTAKKFSSLISSPWIRSQKVNSILRIWSSIPKQQYIIKARLKCAVNLQDWITFWFLLWLDFDLLNVRVALICTANQLTGFFMRATLALNGFWYWIIVSV